MHRLSAEGSGGEDTERGGGGTGLKSALRGLLSLRGLLAGQETLGKTDGVRESPRGTTDSGLSLHRVHTAMSWARSGGKCP